MLNFKFYLIEEEQIKQPLLSWGGIKGKRHAMHYISPFVNSHETLEVGKDHEDVKAGTKVRVIKQHEVNGRHFTEVVPEGSNRSVIIPNNKIKKRPELIRKWGAGGFAAESATADILKKEGMMRQEAKPAGSTTGHDFHILTGNNKELGGEERENINHEIGGESKIGLGAKFGSRALKYHPEKGYHISDKIRKEKPHFAASIENATITVNGKKVNLLRHLNSHWGDPSGGKHLPSVTSDLEDDAPAQAYFKDNDVHILHVGTHGTYRVGHSHNTDTHNTQLPTISGMTGRFVVGRDRRGGSIMISFRPHQKTLKKSDVDIVQNAEHRKKLKENISKPQEHKPENITHGASWLSPAEQSYAHTN